MNGRLVPLVLSGLLVTAAGVRLGRKTEPAGPVERLRTDASSAEGWCAAGDHFAARGEIDKARYCFRQAVQSGPNVPPVLVRTANFHFQSNDKRAGIETMAHLAELAPEYRRLAFHTFRRMDCAPGEVLGGAAVRSRETVQAYFRSLLSWSGTEEMRTAWEWLGAHGYADDSMAAHYVNTLVARKELGAAREVWLRQVGARAPGYLRSGFLFNGDFEYAPTGAALDWRITAEAGVEAERVRGQAYSGAWSLRIRFLGERNLAYEHVWQLALVRPGEHRFQVAVRTEGMEGDQSPRIRVFDAESPARLDVLSEPLAGTRNWVLVTLDVPVAAPTRIVRIQVSRKPSLKFDNRLRGTLWLDKAEFMRIS